METFLSLRHINKTFHATRALRDVSLDFMSGEVHCLAGQNGCGKSTLIKIMSGVYRPDEGAEITLGGKNWSKLTPAASVAQGIQVIYQDLSLFPNLSVWENIAVNHYHHGLFVNRRRLREVAQAAMTSINVTLPLVTCSLLRRLSPWHNVVMLVPCSRWHVFANSLPARWQPSLMLLTLA